MECCYYVVKAAPEITGSPSYVMELVFIAHETHSCTYEQVFPF